MIDCNLTMHWKRLKKFNGKIRMENQNNEKDSWKDIKSNVLTKFQLLLKLTD